MYPLGEASGGKKRKSRPADQKFVNVKEESIGTRTVQNRGSR